MLNCHAKKEAKRSDHFGDILCEKFKLQLAKKTFGPKMKSQAVINYLKWLNQFAVAMEAYPHTRNQHYSSIQSSHTVYIILRITFNIPRCV